VQHTKTTIIAALLIFITLVRDFASTGFEDGASCDGVSQSKSSLTDGGRCEDAKKQSKESTILIRRRKTK
jgi:hypothetical protein